MTVEVINAGWNAPPHIRAFTTLRSGGVSQQPYDSLNLAGHVDDDTRAVLQNRARLRQCRMLPADPVWLDQVHGTHIVQAEQYTPGHAADGSFTTSVGVVCAVLSADCLPLFLCSAEGTQIGLFHVGWKGLVRGMVAKAVQSFERHGETIAWLGPAIGLAAFEIGEEVKIAIEQALQPKVSCFEQQQHGKWRVNLYTLVAHELQRRDVLCEYDSTLCTYADHTRFFSFRRTRHCGRMASIIWMEH